MKFVFSGDPHNLGTDPAAGSLFGIEYQLNVPFEVKDEETAARLRRHSHFTEVTGDTWQPKKQEPTRKRR